MKKFLTMAAIALFTLASCSEDDAPANPGENPTNTVLLRKMIFHSETPGTLISLLNYDSQNRLLNTTDENGVVDSEITYNGNKIIKLELISPDGEVHNRELFEYDSNGKLSVYKTTIIDDFFPVEYNTSKTLYTYNDNGTITATFFSGSESEQTSPQGTAVLTISNGNVIKEVKTNGLGTSTRNFTFDDKNSPFKNIVGWDVMALAHRFGGINNMISDDFVNSDEYDSTVTYTYNDSGYPLTSASSSLAGEPATSQYFYE